MSTSRFWGVFGALLIGTGIGRMAGADLHGAIVARREAAKKRP